ncbi:hypothetical protein [Flavobacterium degerlachei]|jgi:hypothetical protein|uniref:Uncharacterized protein n=1 Tax=Flavobacterium degerlachei TaxID=229203 RepID=A0A1H2QYJ0_9FLAO|nr:hypothetical protein [Flavobacterium degerlachei]SDW12272.1 hypothetical protein SAMN05444338_101293 [Flavobacterium degerlachei]
MKLTNQQITTIDETLVLNGFVYDDIKLELVDHIATEIESEASIEDKPFEVVLKEVFDRWKPQLKPTSHNLLLGYGFLAPKIISDKFADDKKKELIASGITVCLLTVLILLIGNKFQNPSVLSGIVFFLQSTSLVGALLMISGKLFVLKSKINTTHLFWFKKSFNLLLLYGLLIGLGFFPILPSNKNTGIKLGGLIVTLIYLFLLYGTLKQFYKHFLFEKKLSTSKP